MTVLSATKPNYMTFEKSLKKRFGKTSERLFHVFLEYVENHVKPIKKANFIYFVFDFGVKKIEVPCVELEYMIKELKRNEENVESNIEIEPKELEDFFLFFNLIEPTKKGYKMVKDSVQKYGNASFATLLGHILVEKHKPLEVV